MADCNECSCKMIVIGEMCSGRTSLVCRYLTGEFEEYTTPTIGAAHYTTSKHIDEKIVKVTIWETQGVQRTKPLMKLYCRNLHGAMVVYSIANELSFKEAKGWLDELRSHADPHIKIMLVGTHLDLCHRREVTTVEAKAFADKEGLLFMETSAASDTNVRAAFELILRDILLLPEHFLKCQSESRLSTEKTKGLNSATGGEKQINKEDKKQLQKEYKQLQRENKHLRQENDHHQLDKQQLQKENKRILQQNEIYQVDMQQLQKEIKQFQRDNEQLRQQNYSYRMDKQQLQKQFQQLSDEVKILMNEVSALEQEKRIINESWKVSHKEVMVTKEELGRGGWGVIWIGQFREQRVAVKQMHDAITSQVNLDLLHREISTMAQLRHPNLLQFIGAVLDHPSGNPMIITEIMDMSLRKAYEDKLLTPSQQSECVSIMRDVAVGLNYLHCLPDPIIHRDVSSANVLLENKGKGIKVEDKNI